MSLPNYRELMNSGLVDAVVIATPYDLHPAMTLAAVDAGLHVVCAKPLALNVEDAREMAKRADAAGGGKHMTFFTLRWLQHTQVVKKMVDAVQEAMDAALASHRSGQWVNVRPL